MPTLFALFLAGCVLSNHPEVPGPAPGETDVAWETILARPAVIEHEAVVSARIDVDLSGMVNLKHPDAAALTDRKVPAQLVVHVLRHPTHGTWIIDTGVHRGMLSGERGILGRLVLMALKGTEEVEPLADILARQPEPLAGVLITHMHPDHVLGLPDVPPGVPIHIGPGEQSTKSFQNLFLRRPYRRLLDGHAPLRTWTHGPARAPLTGATDILGDGSLWALGVPGHTPGSTAFLALTTDGPTLFVGDTSHTWWGWDNGVEPGSFTEDHAENARSLAALRTLAETHALRVFVGHETDGAGTGVDVEATR